MRKPQRDSEILNYLEFLKEEQYKVSITGSSWSGGDHWNIEILDPLDRKAYICKDKWPVSLRELLKTAAHQIWENTEGVSFGDPVPLVKATWWEHLLRKCGVHIPWKVRPIKLGDQGETIGYAMKATETEEAIKAEM